MTLRDKLIIWVYNKTSSLEKEKEVLLQQRRYQTMDSLDMYENLRADIRISAWNEFIEDMFKIIINCDSRK